MKKNPRRNRLCPVCQERTIPGTTAPTCPDCDLGDDTGVVYFIQAGDDGPIKIGYCTHCLRVPTRLADLQSANAYKLHLRRVLPGSQTDERDLHKKWAKYRLQGEWFSPALELAMEAQAADFGRGRAAERDTLDRIDRAYELGRRLGQVEGQNTAYHDVRDAIEKFTKGVDADTLEAHKLETQNVAALERIKRAA